MGLGVTVGAVLLLAGASQASAAGVSVTSAERLAFAANIGEVNDVTFSAVGANVVVKDAAPLTAGAGCVADNANQVTCANVVRISAGLEDGDDHVRNATSLPSHMQGNAGNDTVEGGAGDDVLLGEAGVDQIYAGDGNDTVNTRGGLADLVDCGPGIDTLIYDSLDHVSATCENVPTAPPPPGTGEAPPPSRGGEPLPVILPAAPGTRDPVKLAVAEGECATRFLGTAGGDRIDGTGSSDRLFGMAGDDLLNGLGGDDCLVGMAGNDVLYGGDGSDLAYGGSGGDRLVGGAGAERLWGNQGNDRLTGGAGNDRLFGGAGRDRLSGGAGDDVLKGGRGRTTYRGGAGRDVIATRNGARDVVDCGGGRDVARVDGADRVRHCERTSVGG